MIDLRGLWDTLDTAFNCRLQELLLERMHTISIIGMGRDSVKFA